MKSQDLFDQVTQQIIDQIESGNVPAWRQSWEGGLGGGMPLNHAGKHYNGGNVIMLWLSAHVHGFKNQYWMTYKQAEALGAQVKKGSKGTHVYFYSRGTKENSKTGEAESFQFAKCYTVFNVDQIDNVPEKYLPVIMNKNPDLRDMATEDFIRATSAKIDHVIGQGNFYRPSTDSINLEPFENFHHAHGYYSTALHELTHWTGDKNRLDRDKAGKKFESGYAFEELVAELGSAFLCAQLGLENEARQDHAAYLQSWLKAFKNDKSFLFKAASHASKAANYLTGLQPSAEAPEETPEAMETLAIIASAQPEPAATTPEPEPQPAKIKTPKTAQASNQFSLF